MCAFFFFYYFYPKSSCCQTFPPVSIMDSAIKKTSFSAKKGLNCPGATLNSVTVTCFKHLWCLRRRGGETAQCNHDTPQTFVISIIRREHLTNCNANWRFRSRREWRARPWSGAVHQSAICIISLLARSLPPHPPSPTTCFTSFMWRSDVCIAAQVSSKGILLPFNTALCFHS